MQPLDPRVEIGRVRLRVGDLNRALSFYAGVLGFEITGRRGSSSALLGTGGYAHHIALFAGDGPADESAGLSTSQRFAIRYPDRVSLGNALLRIEEAGIAVERAIDDGTSESLYVRDPDGHLVELYLRSSTGGARERCNRSTRNGCGRESRIAPIDCPVAGDGRLRGVDAARFERREPAAATGSSIAAASPAQSPARRHTRRV